MGKREKRQRKMVQRGYAEGGVLDTLRDRNKRIDAAVDAAVKPAAVPVKTVAPSPASVSIVPGLADQMAAKQAARVKAEADAAAAAPPPKKKVLGLFAGGGTVEDPRYGANQVAGQGVVGRANAGRMAQIDAAENAALNPTPAPTPAPAPTPTLPAEPRKKFLGLFAGGGMVNSAGLRVGHVGSGFSPWERDEQGNLPSEWGRDASGALESEWNKPKPNMGLKLGSIVTDDEGNQSLMANPVAPKPKAEPNYGLHFADGGGVGPSKMRSGSFRPNPYMPRSTKLPSAGMPYGPLALGADLATYSSDLRTDDEDRFIEAQSAESARRRAPHPRSPADFADGGPVGLRDPMYANGDAVRYDSIDYGMQPYDAIEPNIRAGVRDSSIPISRGTVGRPWSGPPRYEKVGVRDLVDMADYGGRVKSEGMSSTEFTKLSPNAPANQTYKDPATAPAAATPVQAKEFAATDADQVGRTRGLGQAYQGPLYKQGAAAPTSTSPAPTAPTAPTAPPVPAVAAPSKSADTKFINEQLVVPTRPVTPRPVTPEAPAPAAPTGPTLSDLIAPRRKSAAPAAPPTLNVPDVTGQPSGAGRVPPPLLDVPDATGLRTGAGRVPAPALATPDVTGQRHPFNETQVPMQHVRVAATKYGIPTEIAEAQIHTESGGNPKAVGPMTRRGASEGLAQILPSTGKAYGVKQPFDSAEAADFYGVHMRDLLKQHGGNMDEALAAYNTGPGNLAKAKKAAAAKGTTWMDEVPQETRDYITKINKRATANKERRYANGGQIWGGPETDNMSTYKYAKRTGEQVGLRGIQQFADGGTPLAQRGHQINRRGKHGGVKDGAFYGKGGPTEDKVHIRASPGEFIIPADSTKAIGLRKLRTMVAATHKPVHLNNGLADGDEIPAYEEGGSIFEKIGRLFGKGRKRATDAAARAAEATRNATAEFNAGRQAAQAEAAAEQAAQAAAAPAPEAAARTVVPTGTGAPEEVAVVRTPAERLARPEPVIQPAEPSPMGPRGQPAGPSGAPPSPMGPRGPVGPPPTPPPFTLGPDPGAPRGGRTSAPPLGERYANLPPEAQVGEGPAPKVEPTRPAPMDSPYQRAKSAFAREWVARGGLRSIGGGLLTMADPAVTATQAFFDAQRTQDPNLQKQRMAEAAAESGAGVAAGLKAWQMTPGPWYVKAPVSALAGWAGHQAGLGGVRAARFAGTGGESLELPSEIINKQNPRAAAAEPYKPSQTPEQAKAFMEQAVKDAQEGKYGEGLRGGSTAPPLPRAGEVDATDLKAPMGGGFASGIDRDAVNPETGERGMPRLISLRDKRDYNIYGVTDTSTPEEKAADKARRADWTAQSAAIDEKNAKAAEFERRSLRDMVQQNQMNTANYDMREGLRNRDPAAVAAASSTLGQVREAQGRQAVLDAKQADTAGEMAKAKILAEAERYRADTGLQGNLAQADATYKGAVLTAGATQARLNHELGKENAKDFQDEIGNRAKVFAKDDKGKPYLDEAATARNVANLKRFMIDPAADHIAILQQIQPGATSLRDVPREKWGSVLDRAMIDINLGAATGGTGMPANYSIRERGLGDVFAGQGVKSMVDFWPTLANNFNMFAPPERDYTVRSSVPGSLPTDIPLEDLGAGERGRYESILARLLKSKDPEQQRKAKVIADRLGLRLQ